MKRTLQLMLLLSLIALPLAGAHQTLPLPLRILSAKKVFIDNQSGTASLGDKAFAELTQWGRYAITAERSEADLVFLLSGRREVVGAQKNGGPDVRFFSGVSVLDGKTGESLWNDSASAALFRKSAMKRTIDELRRRIERQEKP